MITFDQGVAVLPDDSRANEMVAELKSRKGNHRDRYAYTPHREGMRRNPIHKNTFATIPLPFNKYDEFGRKIEDDGEDTAE